DQKIKGLLLMHLVAATIAALLVITSWWVHWRNRKTPVPLPGYRIPIELLGVAVIGFTAHLGGFLSGINTWESAVSRATAPTLSCGIIYLLFGSSLSTWAAPLEDCIKAVFPRTSCGNIE